MGKHSILFIPPLINTNTPTLLLQLKVSMTLLLVSFPPLLPLEVDTLWDS